MTIPFSHDYQQQFAAAVRRVAALDRRWFYEDHKMALDRKRRARDERVLNKTGEWDNFSSDEESGFEPGQAHANREKYEWRRGTMMGPVTDRKRRIRARDHDIPEMLDEEAEDGEGYSYGAGRSPLHDYDPVSQGSRNYDPPSEFEEAEDDEEEFDRRMAERQERRDDRGIRMTGEDRRRYSADGRPRGRQGRDEPPSFRGQPRPGGKMRAMDELVINARRIGMDSAVGTLGNFGFSRHGIPRGPTYGRDVSPPRIDRREARQMALDSRRRGVKVQDFYSMYPGVERIKRAY
jgi:hypothetical protein